MLSTIDLVELDVLRMTSAPPAADRLLLSLTISSAPISWTILSLVSFFVFQAEDGIRALYVTGVQTCALPISIAHSTPGCLEWYRSHGPRRANDAPRSESSCAIAGSSRPESATAPRTRAWR